MASKKPELHTHGEQPHTPEKKPFSKRHPHLAKAAKAIGTGALALGIGCAPAARAQETTPRTPTTSVQSPDMRVAPATASSPPRPEVRVAEASSTSTRGYASTAAGSGPEITEVRQDEVMQGLVPLIGSSTTYERSLDNPPTNWAIEVNRGPLGTDPLALVKVYAITSDGKIEISAPNLTLEPHFKMYEIPTQETELFGAGVFVLLDAMGCKIFYLDKAANEYKSAYFGPNFTFLAWGEVITAINIMSPEIVNLVVANSSSITRDRQGRIIGVVTGSRILLQSVHLDEAIETGAPAVYDTYIRVKE